MPWGFFCLNQDLQDLISHSEVTSFQDKTKELFWKFSNFVNPDSDKGGKECTLRLLYLISTILCVFKKSNKLGNTFLNTDIKVVLRQLPKRTHTKAGV
jgi:hypothetical protein